MSQFIRFAIVGASNVAVSCLVNILFLCIVRNCGIPYDYIVANIVSFTISVVWSFFWNDRLVFKDKKNSGNERKLGFAKSFAAYGFTGYILGNVLLVIWVDYCGISKYIAPLINGVINCPINFAINKIWVFRKK